MDSAFKVNYDFKGSFIESQSDSRGFVYLTFRWTERCLHRNFVGYETLIRERPVCPPSRFHFEVPTDFLASEEAFRWYVDQLLSKVEDLDRRILQRLVSQIPAAAAEMSGSEAIIRQRRAFLIEVDVDMITEKLMKETEGWNKMAIPTIRGGSVAVGDDGGPVEQMSCAVCLEELSGEIGCMELPCSHVFHRDCAFLWLRQNLSCPLCRGGVS